MMKRTAILLSFLLCHLWPSQAQLQMFFSADSLSSITSPLDLDSLFYWFAADVGVTDSLGGAISNVERVGGWADLSGNGYHLTQDTVIWMPIWFATNGPGSKPAIRFDGSNDFLASAVHWWGSDDITIFMVMAFENATRDATEGTVSRINTVDTRQFDLQFRGTSNSYDAKMVIHQDGTNTPQTALQTNTTYKHANYQVQCWTFSSSSDFTLITDGSLTETTITGTSNSIYNNSQPLLVGARLASAPISFLQGSISEIIVYSRALTATERAAIELYLNRKYDLY